MGEAVLRVVDEAARTDAGRQRHANEDSYYARAPVYAVADGMGGAQAGEVASRIAAEAFDARTDEGTPEQQLARVATEANRRIFELAQEDSSRSGMGTTLTGLLVDDEEVAIVHVGDSRAYVFREGELRRLTRDHSLVEELRRQGRLTPEEAEEHPQRSIITRALGPERDVELDVHTHRARSGDVYLICSDGLTSMVREERVQEILAGSDSLRSAVDELVAEANEMGGRDNITVVLFRVGGDEDRAAADGEPAVDETVVGLRAPHPEPDTGEQRVVAEAAPAAPPPRRERPPRARRAGRRRTVRRAVTALVVLAVLAGAVIAAVAVIRSVYFVGQDDRGLVTLYRGVPYELPLGIDLYDREYVSAVPARTLSATQRRRVLDHQLRSRDDAADIVRGLERGRR
jgi:serine/threonine protein phosphatase PrpC